MNSIDITRWECDTPAHSIVIQINFIIPSWYTWRELGELHYIFRITANLQLLPNNQREQELGRNTKIMRVSWNWTKLKGWYGISICADVLLTSKLLNITARNVAAAATRGALGAQPSPAHPGVHSNDHCSFSDAHAREMDMGLHRGLVRRWAARVWSGEPRRWHGWAAALQRQVLWLQLNDMMERC